MAFRELMMVDVKEILRRWQQGHPARRMERERVAHRDTVKRYVDAAVSCGVTRETELTDEVAGRVAQQVQLRACGDPSEEWRALVERREQLRAWLDDGLTLKKVHELLARTNVTTSYATLRRFAMRELQWRTRPTTVRLSDPPPGQEAQVDFVELGRVLDASTGKQRRTWALVVTLSHSRHLFAWPCFGQKTVDVIEGLEAAWRFFGGVPRTLVPDNMTSVVAKSDAVSPMLTETFADYAQSRGFFVDPARVRHPRDKARVENQVAYVRESFFAGEEFAGLDDMRRRAAHWCAEVAGLRTHGTTRRQPREHYESEEKASMLPAPAEPYDVPVFVDAKVHPDHHVQVCQSLYSVPTAHVGKVVHVRADRSLVRIYVGAQLVKTHARVGRGQRSTDENDYPSHKAAYAMRNIDATKRRAAAHGEQVGRYVDRLLEGPHPWARMRAVHQLLRLVEKYGEGRVNAACQSALAFDVVDVRRIGTMLKGAIIAPPPDGEGARVVPLPTPRFARPPEHFSTRKGGEP